MALSINSWHSIRLSAHEGAPVARRSAGPGPPKPTILFFGALETPEHLNKIEKIPGTFLKIIFCKSQHFGNPKFKQFGKRRAPGHDEDPSDKFFKILDM